MENPEVSVIIPFYNEEDYIETACLSVVNQKGVSIEILAIDDGSTDTSSKKVIELARKYKNIKYIRKENTGLGDSRNIGIDIAKGKYIYFLDGDDMIISGTLKECFEYAEMYNLDVVTFDSVKNKESTAVKNYISRASCPYSILDGMTFLSCELEHGMIPIPVWLYFYRKDYLNNNNLRFEKIIYEDVLFTYRVLKSGCSLTYLPIKYHIRTIKNNSIMHSIKSENHFKGALHNVIALEDIFDGTKQEITNDKIMLNKCFTFALSVSINTKEWKTNFKVLIVEYLRHKREYSIKSFLNILKFFILGCSKHIWNKR